MNLPEEGTWNLLIKYCCRQLPKGKKLKAFRSDSAGYQAGIINYCESKGIEFAIGGDLDEAVVKLINNIPEGNWRPYKTGYIAEMIHTMNKTKSSFRLIVIRRPYQQSMFETESAKMKYTVIATNKLGSMERIVKWYNQRGECSENRIKDLKIGFGMERMPCGQTGANAVFFRIGILAYNAYRLFILKTLDKNWHRCQVQTVRWRLYQTAGKIAFHGGQIYLKVKRSFISLFSDIRTRIWEFANT